MVIQRYGCHFRDVLLMDLDVLLRDKKSVKYIHTILYVLGQMNLDDYSINNMVF